MFAPISSFCGAIAWRVRQQIERFVDKAHTGAFCVLYFLEITLTLLFDGSTNGIHSLFIIYALKYLEATDFVAESVKNHKEKQFGLHLQQSAFKLVLSI